MAKDSRYRVKLTFNEDEQGPIEDLCKSWSRWLPPATSIRQMMLILAENPGAIQKVGTPGAQTTPDDPEVTQAGPGPSLASPSPLKNQDPEEEKKREEEIRKGEDGECEGKISQVQKNAGGNNHSQSAVVDAVTARVIKRVNELRPNKHKFTAPPYAGQVKAILKKKHTELDIVTVVEWAAANCERRDDWEWFLPETILRIRSFAQKLDSALAGVEHGKHKPMAFTDGEKRAERHAARKKTKYPTHKTRGQK